MKLKELLKKYGTQTTSNFDLMKIAKDLNIKPFYYVMKDEIKEIQNNNSKIYVCTNLHNSDEPGIHHSCFVLGSTEGSSADTTEGGTRQSRLRSKSTNYFFDSYGLPPVKEIKDLLQHATYNTFQLQKQGTKLCGQLCMFVLNELKDGRDFLDILLEIREFLL